MGSPEARGPPLLPPGFGPPGRKSSPPGREPRRIVRGPDIAYNFSTRIAYAGRVGQGQGRTDERDLTLSSEIDRLFAPDAVDVAVPLQDAVTLASVADAKETGEVSFDDFAQQLARGARGASVLEGEASGSASGSASGGQVQAEGMEGGDDAVIERDDQAVEALAKWFSSLAAAAEVVEAGRGDGGKAEGVRERVSEGVRERASEETDLGEADSGEGIDESVARFLDATWTRAVNGEMFDWQSGFDSEDCEDGVVGEALIQV